MSSAPWASTVLQKAQNPMSCSLLPTYHLSLSTSRTTRFPHLAPTFTLKPINFSSQPLYGTVSQAQPEEHDEDDEPVIGDCLVFEEGIFNDQLPENTWNFRHHNVQAPKPNNKDADVAPENLIPEGWSDIQKELNITKKERRKIAQQLEYGRRVEKRRQGLMPLNSEEFEKFKREKLKQLNPIVLDYPRKEYFRGNDKDQKRDLGSGVGISTSGRVVPRNPRLAVYGGGLEDVSALFDSGGYVPGAMEKSEGRRKLFSKEETSLMNRRVPDIAIATSGKWLPLHTLAASGEFYLATSLLKHNLDINAPDKNGLTAIHKAILSKKQAVFDFLLRESTNPFVRDSEGATLLHYAVFSASSQMIKILLLYNVDINLQDNDGWTPLHLAVQSRRTDIVRLLLIKGADKTLKNQDGLTALDLCLYSGRDTRTYELIKLFKRIN